MIIQLDNVSKRYGKTTALHGISLKIAAGGIIGLLGPNGAGKTTLVEIIEGLRTPCTGRVSVLGLNPTCQAKALRELIGVQLQSTAVPQELTPLETLRLFAALFHTALSPAELLQRVGLADKARSRNATLSGGQRQRLAIALALINDPELVILDEPTSGLDPAARCEIHDYIAALRSAQKTVLLSTHSVAEAEQLCDRVILLRAGEVVADGSPLELIRQASRSLKLSIVLSGEFDPAPLLRASAVLEERHGAYQRFSATDLRAVTVALGVLLQAPGVSLVELQTNRPKLEEVYLTLTAEKPSLCREGL